MLSGLSLGLAEAENTPWLALLTKSNSLQIQSVASTFFLTTATNVRELKGSVYSYCISRQGHVAEKCLDKGREERKRVQVQWGSFHNLWSQGYDSGRRLGDFKTKDWMDKKDYSHK